METRSLNIRFCFELEKMMKLTCCFVDIFGMKKVKCLSSVIPSVENLTENLKVINRAMIAH